MSAPHLEQYTRAPCIQKILSGFSLTLRPILLASFVASQLNSSNLPSLKIRAQQAAPLQRRTPANFAAEIQYLQSLNCRNTRGAAAAKTDRSFQQCNRIR